MLRLGAIDQLPEATKDFENIPTRPHAYSKKRENIQKKKEWKRRRESLEGEAEVVPKKKMRGQVQQEPAKQEEQAKADRMGKKAMTEHANGKAASGHAKENEEDKEGSEGIDQSNDEGDDTFIVDVESNLQTGKGSV